MDFSLRKLVCEEETRPQESPAQQPSVGVARGIHQRTEWHRRGPWGKEVVLGLDVGVEGGEAAVPSDRGCRGAVGGVQVHPRVAAGPGGRSLGGGVDATVLDSYVLCAACKSFGLWILDWGRTEGGTLRLAVLTLASWQSHMHHLAIRSNWLPTKVKRWEADRVNKRSARGPFGVSVESA